MWDNWIVNVSGNHIFYVIGTKAVMSELLAV